MKSYYHAESDQINALALQVWNTLGSGFTQEVYTDALEVEFADNGIPFARNVPVPIYYKDKLLPHSYTADFLVHGKIVLCVNARKNINEYYQRKIISMLQVQKLHLGIYINYTHTGVLVNRVTVGSKFVTCESLKEAKDSSSLINLPSAFSAPSAVNSSSSLEEAV
jgi:GxxExxY protein